MDAPILSFGETLGVLGVCSREPDRFDESDLRLIEGFASLASVALRNAEAYEESTRQTQVERGFYRIASVLSEPLSAEATLDAVAQAAAEALGGDSAAVLRSGGDDLQLAGAHSLDRGLAAYLRAEAAALTRPLAPARCSPRAGSSTTAASPTGWRRLPRRRSATRCSRFRSCSRRVHGLGLVLVFFRGRDGVRRRAARAGRPCRRCSARRARAERAVRARAPLPLAGATARPRRPRAGGRARPGQPSRPSPCGSPSSCSRQRRRLDSVARGRRGGRARRRRETGQREAVGARTPSTAWLVGDIVQTRSTRAIADVRDDARIGDADTMLAAGYAGYLGVPMVGPGRVGAGHPCRLRRRPRESGGRRRKRSCWHSRRRPPARA